MIKRRRNEFLLLEQDSPEGGEKGGKYTPPRERILKYPEATDSLIETNASLDEIVDRYLQQYEKEAVPINSEPEDQLPQRQPIAERRRKRNVSSLFNFLFEQDAPPDAGGGAPADAGAAPSDSGGGAGGGEAPKGVAETAPVPKINIREFAEGVARLANNYQTLLDPKSVILTRAMFYISKNYSPRLAKEMMSILERDFDLTPKNQTQQKKEIPRAPSQANAGPDSGGGVPSGGGK